MLISKFDLYKGEWLELVFDDRNKEYGAYYLRKNYADNMVKAMGITFSGVILILGAFFIHASGATVENRGLKDTVLVRISPPPVPPIKKPEPPTPPKIPNAEVPAKPIATIRNVPPVVAPDVISEKPVENASITTQISTVTTKGDPGIEVPKVETPVRGDGPAPVPDNTVYPAIGLEAMPEPVGGEGAWSKFLSRNLRFPAPAQEDQVSGKVYLTFIIEKDGSLSNITVIKPAGHGFDEEALRVLKLAKAWKPGRQNGQAVRVKYTIPINFQYADNN